MTPIIIQSSLVTDVSGNCYASAGQSITFTIVSGITSSSTSFEWFLNGNSVYFGTSYTLSSASSNDEVYVKVVDCPGQSCLRIGDWIEDNDFYFNDVILPGPPQTYEIDMNASFDYKIHSVVLQCSNIMSYVELRINDIAVVWKYGNTGITNGITIDVTTGIGDTEAYGSNIVRIGDDVTLYTGASDGSSNLLQGKVRFLRYITLSPTTTTTTTASPVTTTTTTISPVTTTTTTIACIQFCFEGLYQYDDPVHPNGGTVVFINCLGYLAQEPFIYMPDGIISIYARSIISHVGCSTQICPTPTTTTTTTAAVSVSTVFIHIPN